MPEEKGLTALSINEHDWMAASRGMEQSATKGRKSSLIRSPVVQDLPSLLEQDDFEPVTPERSPVPSPYKRPMSNTPNAMLGKKVHFLSPVASKESNSSDELLGITAGIGAVFEDDEDAADDSSIISVPVVIDDEPVYLYQAVAARSFPALPVAATLSSSGSASVSDDVFTTPSPQSTSAPTTADGSESGGSPAPDVIPQKAQHPPAPVQEEMATVTEKHNKSRWASIKGSLRKRPAVDPAVSRVEQFESSQRRSASWTKVERKLQKAQPSGETKEMKKGGFRRECKKAFKAFVHGLAATVPASRTHI